MEKISIDAYSLLERVRAQKPIVHHLTNWVTIYDCANIVKVLGGSPVMAHAKEEVAEMASLASALVLNIGTLTVELVEAMKIAASSAKNKGIPIILDVCGAGATTLRDKKSFELLENTHIDIIKGNVSEIARIAGENVVTKGVDAVSVNHDMRFIAERLARERKCTVVVTGKEDIISDTKTTYCVANGDPIMAYVVGTGCMAASVIATFAAIEKNFVYASTAGLVCFEIAAELAAKQSPGPGSFKEQLFDYLFRLDKKTIDERQKVTA
ncbi:MAG: hydroxyethylthiazole kinase [Candidatus Omnitrophota bacterium]